MSLVNGVQDFVNELRSHQIIFGVIGGIAVFAYGGERTTFDVDFLIDGEHRDKLHEIVEKLNFKVVNENEEVLQISGPIQVDIIFANRLHTKNMLKRVKVLDGFAYPVVAPEDLIGLKIQGFANNKEREYRDKGDILSIMQNVSDLDFKKIKEYADIFDVWNEIEEIRKRS